MSSSQAKAQRIRRISTSPVDADGKNVVTVEFKLNKTEASDISIPTGKTYKAHRA